MISPEQLKQINKDVEDALYIKYQSELPQTLKTVARNGYHSYTIIAITDSEAIALRRLATWLHNHGFNTEVNECRGVSLIIKWDHRPSRFSQGV